MRATAAVSSRRGNRTFAVSLLAAVVFLAAAPSGRADTGPASEAAPTDAGLSASTADAPGSAPDGPGNSGDAPGHAADGPGNSGDAPGHDPNGPGNSENAPGHQADQGTSIDQGATASAAADQGNVGNTHVTVRVDEPGNGSPVGQENRAEAQADAGTSAVAETPGEASITQDVHADSSATQSDVSNTAVVVRVGSPGDDGAVSQSNVAAAGATAAGDQPGAQEAADGERGAERRRQLERLGQSLLAGRRRARHPGQRGISRSGRRGVRRCGGRVCLPGRRPQHERVDPRRELRHDGAGESEQQRHRERGRRRARGPRSRSG